MEVYLDGGPRHGEFMVVEKPELVVAKPLPPFTFRAVTEPETTEPRTCVGRYQYAGRYRWNPRIAVLTWRGWDG